MEAVIRQLCCVSVYGFKYAVVEGLHPRVLTTDEVVQSLDIVRGVPIWWVR